MSHANRPARSARFVPGKHCFVLHVALNEIKPLIWRRVAVPASITLDLLHDVIQAAMGWEDYHLHQFDIAGQRFTEDPEEPDNGMEDKGVVLGELIRQPKGSFAYTYDFGDGWRHTITLEKVEPIRDWREVHFTCLAGERNCPPEDVGGPRGYENYLDCMANSRHPEHRSMLRWRGPFDSEAFDVGKINRELAKLARWSRPRKR